MNKPISIVAISSVSPLGLNLDEVWESYQNDTTFIIEEEVKKTTSYQAKLPSYVRLEIKRLRESNNQYKSLDDSVLFAIYATRNAVKIANWNHTADFGINIGSSRGATQLFETYHECFIQTNKVKALSSPTTTLGNISSWVAQDVKTKGPEISHSITCSTALHALLNGIAWINSEMCDKFLVGGSEAPLTAFTIAQMQALKIYAKKNKETKVDYPCRAMDVLKKENSMVLGEASSLACLESGAKENALAIIEGVGYATELLEHNVSISAEANCFKESMKMALGNYEPEEVDVIVTHTPGTIKGDKSELAAIDIIFGDKLPALTNNKWKIGHTLGASGMLSVEMAILMLKHQQFIAVPFVENNKSPKKIRKVMVNAVGFGGNAVSILLSK